MENHLNRYAISKYTRNTALYQPDAWRDRRRFMLICLLAAAILIGLAALLQAAESPSNYLVLKGGLYPPSMSHNLDNLNRGSASHLDSNDDRNAAGEGAGPQDDAEAQSALRKAV